MEIIMDKEIGALFRCYCQGAVTLMKQHDMNEYLIATILTEIRSAALTEEIFRIQCLLKDSPPHHARAQEMEDYIKN